MAYLISATAAIPDTLVSRHKLEKSQTSGIIVGLFFMTLLGNACGVRVSWIVVITHGASRADRLIIALWQSRTYFQVDQADHHRSPVRAYDTGQCRR